MEGGVGGGGDTMPSTLIGSVTGRVLKRVALPKHIPGRLRGAATALLGGTGPSMRQ